MFDTEYTREPVCPHCGHERRDAWELNFDHIEMTTVECENCEKEFTVYQHISIDYSTWIPEKS